MGEYPQVRGHVRSIVTKCAPGTTLWNARLGLTDGGTVRVAEHRATARPSPQGVARNGSRHHLGSPCAGNFEFNIKTRRSSTGNGSCWDAVDSGT